MCGGRAIRAGSRFLVAEPEAGDLGQRPIASQRGLVTPVLREVENSSLTAVSAQVKGFVEQANAGRLQRRDLEGGSITISNLGMYGVDEFAAIINPPQSAILASARPRPRCTSSTEDPPWSPQQTSCCRWTIAPLTQP